MTERTESPVPPRGLIISMLSGYGDLRISTKSRLAVRPGAGEAYAWLLAAGLLIYSCDLVAKAAEAHSSGLVQGETYLHEWIVSAMLGAIAFLPAAVTLAAVPAWLALRFAFGGSGSCRETTLAAAWACLLAAPACALASLLQAAIHLSPLSERPAELLSGATGAAALAISVWIWSQCSATVHGFRSGVWLFGATTALGSAAWWIAAGGSAS